MCGIAGIVYSLSQNKTEQGIRSDLERMGRAVQHRGPDGSGVWVDSDKTIGLVHQRLSIIDLSAQGTQPMLSQSGRWVVTFNGEIYNFHEIRTELGQAGVRVERSSDTATLLEAIEFWGMEKAVAKCKGMFAFAAYNISEKSLFLARDRWGEKPLYYGDLPDGGWGFASELRSFEALFKGKLSLNSEALDAFLQFSFIPAPYSVYKGIHKLRPGEIMHWRLGEVPRRPSFKRFFIPKLSQTREGTEIELEDSLRNAVQRQLVADVEVGALLSGGIDSSLIVLLMSQLMEPKNVKTFSVGFTDKRFDESSDSKRIAKRLGTDHHELILDSKNVQTVAQEIGNQYDEPFADSSQIPTYLIFRWAREKVKVVLTGDGGDEMFMGYHRHVQVDRLLKCPTFLRSPLAIVAGWMAGGLKRAQGVEALLSNWIRQPAHKLEKVSNVLGVSDSGSRYLSLIREFPMSSQSNWSELLYSRKEIQTESEGDWVRFNDMVFYLPNDILTKVDRASMSVGLEARAPYLDSDLIQTVLSMNSKDLIAKGKGKIPLRQILRKYFPDEWWQKPKSGFAIPLEDWLNGPLSKWAQERLMDSTVRNYSTDPTPAGKWRKIILAQWLSNRR